MSLFDTLFSGNNQTTQSQQTQLGNQAGGLTSILLDRTGQVANQPYQTYAGQRQAGFTGDQYAAFDTTRGIGNTAGDIYNTLANEMATNPSGVPRSRELASAVSGLWSGSQNLLNGQPGQVSESGALAQQGSNLVDQTVAGTMGLTGRFSDADLSGYMNPYTQAVIDPALEDISRRAAQERNQLNANSARTGSFGGSRNGLAQQEQERNVMGEMGRLSANERAKAYNEASNQYRLDQQNIPKLYEQALGQLTTAQGQQQNAINASSSALAARGALQQQGLVGQQALANTANLEQQRYNQLGQLSNLNKDRLNTQVSSLLTTGGLQQQQEQNNLDRAYQDFTNQRDYGKDQLSTLRQTLGMGDAVTGTTRTTTTQNPQSSVAGQAAGALGSLASIFPGTTKSVLSGAGNYISSLFGGGGGAADYGGFADSSYLFAKGGLVSLKGAR